MLFDPAVSHTCTGRAPRILSRARYTSSSIVRCHGNATQRRHMYRHKFAEKIAQASCKLKNDKRKPIYAGAPLSALRTPFPVSCSRARDDYKEKIMMERLMKFRRISEKRILRIPSRIFICRKRLYMRHERKTSAAQFECIYNAQL